MNKAKQIQKAKSSSKRDSSKRDSSKRGGRYMPKNRMQHKPSRQSIKDVDDDLSDFYEKMSWLVDGIVSPDGFQAWLGWTEPEERSNYGQCLTTQDASKIAAKFMQDVLVEMSKACNADSKKYEKVNDDLSVQGFSHWLPLPLSPFQDFKK